MDSKISLRGEFGKYLYSCFKRGLNGSITIRTRNNTHTMYFANGKPSFIKEQKTTMPLGRVLVELGMIDNRAYDESLMEMAKTGERQGEILLKKGLITREQLNYAISVQFYRKALKFFEISDGEVTITEGDLPEKKGAENIKNISIFKILYNGIKSLNKDHINQLLPINNNTTVSRREELDITIFSLPLSPEETTVIEKIREKTPVSQLLSLKILSDTEVAQLIYFLFLTELIEVSTLDLIEVKEADENYIIPSGIYKPADKVDSDERESDDKTIIAPISSIEDREWIRDIYSKFQLMDYFEFFGIEKDAPQEEINRAYQNILKRLTSVKNDSGIDEELSVMIDQLLYFAEEAYNTLISEKSRKEYSSIISSYYSRSELDEGRAEIEFTKGEIFLSKRNFLDAFSSFKSAIEMGGQRPEYMASYGLALYLNPEEPERSRVTLGKLYIKKAISKNPRCLVAHLYSLLISCIEGNKKEINTLVNNIREIFPNNDRVNRIISEVAKLLEKRPLTGEIHQALKEGKKDPRLENLFDIFFEAD